VPACHSPQIKEAKLHQHSAVRAGLAGLVPTGAAADSDRSREFARLSRGLERPGCASADKLLALATFADQTGRQLIHHDPAAALPWFRDAAAYSKFALTSGDAAECATCLRATAIEVHNHAVAELIRCAGAGRPDGDPHWRAHLAKAGVQLAQASPDRATLPIDELWVAEDFKVKHLEFVGRDGLGVPLVEVSHWHHRPSVPDRFLPEKLRIPATAVARPVGPLENGAWRAQPLLLDLYDSTQDPCLFLGLRSGNVALASDLTTPLAHQFIKSPLKTMAMGGLLQPDTYDSVPGIFMHGPYKPGRIPVLFIHGLWSSPEAWLRMANRLQADPVLRTRYQFWYAYYPTGAAVAVSAMRIRRELQALRDAFDPQYADAAFDQMVVVGHSLGGVLSKLMIQSSEHEIERAVFTRPLDQITMSPASREMLEKLAFFEPVPSIRRAVFISAPHRGSNMANRVIGRLGSSLVRKSGDVVAIHDEILAANGPEVFTPAYREWPPTGIDNLAWESPILKATADMPTAPGVPYHSIIGNVVPHTPQRYWTDGVVSYESAHLYGAQSELVIKHNHFANETPEAAAEVRRILRLHLASLP
jgi:pimeloyl-ACP methyl ester carboxylesterase